MKFIATIALALAATVSAFAPSNDATARASVAVQETVADLEVLAKKLNPVIGFYDPINLSAAEFWGTSNESTIGFLRHAEIKHGRVAMFAFVGYCAHANGFKFPWAMQLDGTPFPSETNPPVLWDTISDSAKWQILSVIAFLEFWSELSTSDHKHYMSGGKPGDFPDFTSGSEGIPHPVPFNFYDPFKFSAKRSEEAKERGLLVEINNGRLAMLGIFGFVSESKVEGSVPALKGLISHYDGEVMAPFNENILGMPFNM